MQIPPTTALLNVAASLPAMGVVAAPAAAKAAAPVTPPPANAASGDAARSGVAQRRGSVVNIVV